MKKLLGILLIAVFAFSIYFSISNDAVTKTNASTTYASIVPIPPPDKPGRGCWYIIQILLPLKPQRSWMLGFFISLTYI